MDVTDQAVLDYLRKKGLGSAALELQNLLQSSSTTPKTTEERLQEDDAVVRNQRSLLTKSTGGGYGYDRDAAWPIVQWGVPEVPNSHAKLGVEEARAYLDSFTNVQLWVLALPDEDGRQVISNPIQRAKQLLDKNNKEATLQSVVAELTKKTEPGKDVYTNLPPSCKHELLAVTFALLVHTYCELLEVGMESTAHSLRDAFVPVYQALYPSEYQDLYQCNTVDDIVRLNSHNAQHMEAISNLKAILVQVASYQLRRQELNASMVTTTNNNTTDTTAEQAKLAEYDKSIAILQQKYQELSQKASQAFEKMHDVPFLRRARAVRWQLTMSNATYSLLASYLQQQDLLMMSTLLQTKCELHVERRDPLPFTPACVIAEWEGDHKAELNRVDIAWAAPALRTANENVPFPKYHLDDEYESEEQVARDKTTVEFNRAILKNGFRRLEALLRKQEFENLPESGKSRLRENDLSSMMANPLEPSIVMATLCANGSGGPKSNILSGGAARSGPVAVSSIWEEAGVGICCAKLSPPDGRLIAAGCDDAAVRIWDAVEQGRSEPSKVLLGHKNGFPVFSVDWNRDGRSLLSAGGDGSVRLWDTMATGPFGEVVPLTAKSGISSTILTATEGTAPMDIENEEPTMDVSGTKPEKSADTSGAALVVYRGHVPSTPVWSVAFAPCGYYFASAGGDASARLWTTDRTKPVRLFTGHTASNVNCVQWHPNCNYIATGCDDRTVRLWDVQTGRTVRLLDGCTAGISAVQISPSGQYAAGADYSGMVHLWDLGTGKKVTELRTPYSLSGSRRQKHLMIHALSFSTCGSVLATGGDDCCVSIWDVRSERLQGHPLIERPTKAFLTKKSMVLDLSFTKRNLLLSVGKYITPIPFVSPDVK